jgi:formate dehydrogenase subunit gamma
MNDAGATDAALAAALRALEAHRGVEGPLLPILHALQAEMGHVPRAALPPIAAALNLSRAEVHGVVSYYHDFRERPVGRRHLRVCAAESCQAMGGEALLAQAQAATGCSEAEPTSADGTWTVESVSCLGLCAVSPAAELDGRPIGRLTATRLGRALR